VRGIEHFDPSIFKLTLFENSHKTALIPAKWKLDNIDIWTPMANPWCAEFPDRMKEFTKRKTLIRNSE
jgi:hypothetical protein